MNVEASLRELGELFDTAGSIAQSNIHLVSIPDKDRDFLVWRANMLRFQCQYLTQRRDFDINELDNGDSHSSGRKRLKTDSSARLYTAISEFWKFISSRIETLADQYALMVVDHYNLNQDLDWYAEQHNGVFRYFNVSMEMLLDTFERFISLLAPITEYSFLNYTKIMRDLCCFHSAFDFAFVSLIKKLKLYMGSNFKLILKDSFEVLKDKNYQQEGKVQYSLISLFHYYKIEVDENVTVSEFVNELINHDISELTSRDISDDYFERISSGATAEMLLIKCCGFPEQTESRYVSLVLDKQVFFKILACQLDKLDKILKSGNCNIKLRKNDVQYSLCAYYTRHGKKDDYYRLVSVFFNDRFKNCPLERNINEVIFIECTKLMLLFYFDNQILQILMSSLCEKFGGVLKMYENYEKLLEYKIRKYNRSHELWNKNNSDIEKPYRLCDDIKKHQYYERFLIMLPSRLKFDSSFLRLHQQKLFRRAVLQGPSIYESISDFSYLEMNILFSLISEYETSDEFHYLYDLYTSLRKSYVFYQQYSKDHGDQVVPLVIDKKSVPTAFQKEENENVILPEILQRQWGKLVEYYNSTLKTSASRTLVPAYALQHCDVETEFLVEGTRDKYVTFNISVYQTCVLNLFNDHDKLDIAKIMQLTGLSERMSKAVITSYLSAGIFKEDKGTYTIDSSFKADPRKLKDGKLRIPMAPGPPSRLRRDTSSSSSTASATVSTSASHNEGYSSLWIQEVIKAAIVRTLKANGKPMNFDTLFEQIKTGINGVSVGECKESINRLVSEKIISQTAEGYTY